MKQSLPWHRLLLLLFTSPYLLVAADSPFAKGRWIDLTHSFSQETLFWPTEDGFILEQEFHGQTEKGYFYASNRFESAEHGGTHIDAPLHFAEGQAPVDELSISQLAGEAVVVDVSAQAAANADYQVTAADLQAWEKTHGEIPANAILLLSTGFARRWPDAESYLGTKKKGLEGVANLHFPGLHPDAASWLTTERTIKAIGIDTASIDFGQSTLYESHRTLFVKGIPAFENVGLLDALPATGAYVIALPMKIKGGSGGPLRIVAWVAEK